VELARMAKSAAFGTRSLGPIVRLGETDHVWTFNTAARVSTLPQPSATPSNHPYIAFNGDVQPWNGPVTKPWTLKRSTAEDALPPTMLPLADAFDGFFVHSRSNGGADFSDAMTLPIGG
jgi:hypothetical protein